MSQNQINLNVDELRLFLTHIMNNNKYIQSQGKIPVTVNVEGHAGIGKTSVILQLAKERGLEFVKLNLAEIEELGDIVGFPIRQFQLCKQILSPVKEKSTLENTRAKIEEIKPVVTTIPESLPKSESPVYEIKSVKKQVMIRGKPQIIMVKEKVLTNYQEAPVKQEPVIEPVREIIAEVPAVIKEEQEDRDCIWVDEHAITEYIKRGYEFTGQKRMSYCPPEWIADRQGGGILLLDDFSRAETRMIQAAMELINRQEYISWKLPKDWTILMTCNPDNGDYLVQSQDSAQKTRYITVNLKFDVECWARYAEKENVDTRC